MGTLILLWFALFAAVAYAILHSGTWILLFFIPAAIAIAYSTQKEVSHKPQKQKIPHLALGMFLFVVLSIILAMYYQSHPIFIPLYCIGVFGIVFACWMVSKMSKSMSDTGEIDAIAWLLITTPPQHPAIFFKKAAQMTGLNCIGVYYRPRLLESLMPLLTLFIILHSAPQHPTRSSNTHSPSSTGNLSSDDDPDLENLEIYVACLARLSEFEDCEGSLGCLREDARQHPKLEQPLIRKLVVLADPQHGYQVGLRNAATKVLKNYKLDREGIPVRSPATVALNAAATVLRRAASLNRMLNVSHGGLNSQEEQGRPNLHRPVELAIVEAPHSSGETEEA